MHSLDSALSALRASQQALQTIGNNIANASTPGYHRQQVDLVDRRPFVSGGLAIGQGVDVAAVRRLRDDAIEVALLNSTAASGQQSAELAALRQIESLLTPSESSLHARVQDFFNKWELLSSDSSEAVRRQEVIQSAVGIADELNSLGAALNALRSSLATEIDAAVAEVNIRSAEVAALNKDIQIAEARGVTPNDLLDLRDQLVTELAELIGAEIVPAGASDGVRLADGASVITTQYREISTRRDGTMLRLVVGEQVQAFVPTTGRLAGLIAAQNSIVPEFQEQLNQFASGLLAAVNSVHAAGLGAGGGVTLASSSRTVMPTDAPLVAAATDFPVREGQLVVGMTNQATGIRTLHQVAISPADDSLDDVAAALGALPGLTATVDADSRRLSLAAMSGFSFDFVGGLPGATTVAAASGTSIPEVSGQFHGQSNGVWTVSVLGTGTVGAETVGAGTDLTIQVRDESGRLLHSASVAEGYAPGDAITLPDGVRLHVPAGTLNDGDTFQFPVIADPDTSGILAALGIHDLFTGAPPGTLSVNSRVLDDPARLAVSQTGEVGDRRIAVRMAALADQSVLAGGDRTFADFLADETTRAGIRVAHTERELTGLSQRHADLFAQREAVSGVNPDEELVHMLAFQRMFQSAARFLTSVNETFDELLGLVR